MDQRAGFLRRRSRRGGRSTGNVDDNKHDDHDDHNAYERSDGADSADGGFRFSHGFDGRENGPVVPACQAYLPLLRTILERQACRLRQIMVPVSTARRFFCFPTPETDAATRRPYHLDLFESWTLNRIRGKQRFRTKDPCALR